MRYLEAKSDLAFIQKFKADVEKLWALEDSGREGIDTSTLPRRTARGVERSYAQRAEGYEPARDEGPSSSCSRVFSRWLVGAPFGRSSALRAPVPRRAP